MSDKPNPPEYLIPTVERIIDMLQRGETALDKDGKPRMRPMPQEPNGTKPKK